MVTKFSLSYAVAAPIIIVLVLFEFLETKKIYQAVKWISIWEKEEAARSQKVGWTYRTDRQFDWQN